MQTHRSYTHTDRQDYDHHTSELRRLLQGMKEADREKSKLIHKAGGHFKELRDRDLFGLGKCADADEWGRKVLGLGVRQGSKYIRIFESFTVDELGGLPGEVELLNQIALSRAALRDTITQLAVVDKLGYKAIQQGRVRAQEALDQGMRPDAACELARRVALEQARRDDRADGPPRPKGGYDRTFAGDLRRLNAQIRVVQKRLDSMARRLARGERCRSWPRPRP